MTYSSSVALSRRNYGRRNQNTVTFSAVRNQTLGPVSNTIILNRPGLPSWLAISYAGD
jgi:hypothetical protein